MEKIKYPWYAAIWFIAFGFLISIPSSGVLLPLPIISMTLRYLKYKKEKNAHTSELQTSISSLEQQKTSLEASLQEIEQQLRNKQALFASERQNYVTTVETEIKQANQRIITQAQQQANQIISNAQAEAMRKTSDLQVEITRYSAEKEELVTVNEKMDKQVKTAENRLRKLKVEFEGAKNFLDNYPNAISISSLEQSAQQLIESYDEHSLLKNLIELDCHYKNSKELRKDMNKIKKDIDKLLETYVARYTTKINRTIYQLMIIGLQAEFQTILYTLTYSKLDEAQANVRDLIRRYLAICSDGNQSILSTLTRFLNELEPLFLQGVEVEYRYYVEREKEKEEQRELREQMRQEAAEKKALQEAQKKLEQEEAKYEAEMQRNRELLATTTDSAMLATLEARIRELEQQHEQIEEKREEILKRANGQAGHVYIISNLGAFGENMFKIGMTRRLDPMERIDELGSASVPFKFDIHAMMFSDNAVALENELHNRLSAQRVNKVNLRKEFFYTNVAELQALVEEIDPTAEFRPTLLAQEFYQSKEVVQS